MYGQAIRIFAGFLLLIGALFLSRSIKKAYLRGAGMRPFKALYISLLSLSVTSISVCASAFMDVSPAIGILVFAMATFIAGIDLLLFYRRAGGVPA